MGCAWNVLQVLFSSRSLFPPNLKEKEGESRVSLKARPGYELHKSSFYKLWKLAL